MPPCSSCGEPPRKIDSAQHSANPNIDDATALPSIATNILPPLVHHALVWKRHTILGKVANAFLKQISK